MNNKRDLKIIKKKYGEKMAHLCHRLFPTILESDGTLINILNSNFNSSNYLYDDIINNELELTFKNYIYNIYYKDIDLKETEETLKTPKELLNSVGYDLYYCHNEEEIQKFKKYYHKGEELCTFKGNRLETNYVYFAVKKNANDLKREDYSNPMRQDTYGTSVISIQFARNETHNLSIKNRYNHTVDNPDATYSNNLDNIVFGLTASFAKYEGMIQKQPNTNFEIPNYVKASDGKFYKYNYEINNVYYCIDNIIIDNGKVIKYNKDKYLVIDYFILDLENKKLYLYDNKDKDGFTDTINNIKNIFVTTSDSNKKVDIITNKGNITITLNKSNQIIGYINNYIEKINNNFLSKNKTLENLELNSTKSIGSWFLNNNNSLKVLSLSNVEIIKDHFLKNNNTIINLNLSNLKEIGHCGLMYNKSLEEIEIPSLSNYGNYFLAHNTNISLSSKHKR